MSLSLPHFLDWINKSLHLQPFWFGLLFIVGPVGIIITLAALVFIVINVLKYIVLPLASFMLRKADTRGKKQEKVFLELTFPSDTSKSALATEQLYVFLHTRAKQLSIIEGLLQRKKSYSLEIVSTREEGIRYIMVAPQKEADMIRRSLMSYLPGLKIREVEDYFSENFGEDGSVETVELKLSGNFVLPLDNQKTLTEHDPIAYLTGSMTQLRPEELMAFQVVVTPLSRYTHRKELNHLGFVQQKIYNNSPLAEELFKSPLQQALAIPWAITKGILWSISFVIKLTLSLFIALFDTKGENVPLLAKELPATPLLRPANPYEEQLQETVKGKIDQPLFETSLRLLVKAHSREEHATRTAGFLSSLGPLASSYQSLTVKKGIRKASLVQFRSRQISLRNNPILSSSELTDIYHFPYTQTTKTEDLIKTKSPELPAPLSYKQGSTKLDNAFAVNNFGGTETKIGLTLEERRRHAYILGATGSGKTTLLATMIHQDILNGKGVCVIDPHGQLVERLLTVIPQDRLDDVVWFAPDDSEHPIGLNLLELPSNTALSASQLQKQRSLIASSINSIFQKIYDARYFGPRMEYILRNTVLTALETPSPTLLTLHNLLTKARYRKEVIQQLQNPILKDFWVHEFERLGSLQRNQVISPITNKIGGLLSSPINYNILTRPKSTLNFDELMNSGKILLCDLSKGKIGEDETSFFGSLIIAQIQLAALRRISISESERKDFYLYVDEFQNFATATFAELVSEARKYRLSTILAHQSTSQIENRDIVKIILANVGTVMCFKTANPEDEQFILPIFSPVVSKHEIRNLPLYHFYMKVSVGEVQDAFLAKVEDFTVEGSDEVAQLVIEQSRNRYGTSPEELEAVIEPQPGMIVLPQKQRSATRQVVKSSL